MAKSTFTGPVQSGAGFEDNAAGVYIPSKLSVNFAIDAAATAAGFDGQLWIADKAYKVTAVRERHGTAGSDPSARVDVKKVASGTAKASGTTVLAATIDVSSAADTNKSPALSATAADLTLAAGDAIGIVGSGTLTALDGVSVTVYLQAQAV